MSVEAVNIRAEEESNQLHVQLYRKIDECVTDPAEVLEVCVNVALFALQRHYSSEVIDSVIEVLRTLKLKSPNVH